MPRVSIWLPEGLHRAVKAAGLPVSDLAQRALLEELERQRKVSLLDAYLVELDSNLGPASAAELEAAAAWAEGLERAEGLEGADPAPAAKPRSA